MGKASNRKQGRDKRDRRNPKYTREQARRRRGEDLPREHEVEVQLPELTKDNLTMRRKDLPPELRHLAEDDEFGIIIAAGPDPTPPDGAGSLLGELKVDITASDGTVLPAGSLVWADTRGGSLEGRARLHSGQDEQLLDVGRPRPLGESQTAVAEGVVPAGFLPSRRTQLDRAADRGRRAATGTMIQALEEQSEGLSARLAQGLSADEMAELAPAIARAASISGAPSGTYSFTTDEPTVVIEGVPDEPAGKYRKRGKRSRKPGQWVEDPIPSGQKRVSSVPAEELRHELGPVTRAVLDAVPFRQPGDPSVLALRASEVLDMHAHLTELNARPDEHLLRWYRTFMQRTIGEAHKAGGTEGARESWEGMFWPATTDREWTAIVARLLGQARTYQITAEMVDKVTEQYTADLAAGSYVIERDDLPWPAGFAWLDAPLVFTDRFGRSGMNRVITWGPEILEQGSRRVPGARIVSWSWHDDRDAWWTEQGGAAMLRLGGLAMAHAITFPYNARLNVTRDAAGLATQDDTIRWTRTLWRTLSSEISATRTHDRIDRHVARRARRSLRHDLVHVVTLRRKNYVSEAANGHRDVEWTCRWPVKGFWRHTRRDPDWEDGNRTYDENGRRTRHHATPDEYRECCAICGAKVTFVGAFTKGPPGAPWKDQGNRTVWRLAR